MGLDVRLLIKTCSTAFGVPFTVPGTRNVRSGNNVGTLRSHVFPFPFPIPLRSRWGLILRKRRIFFKKKIKKIKFVEERRNAVSTLPREMGEEAEVDGGAACGGGAAAIASNAGVHGNAEGNGER